MVNGANDAPSAVNISNSTVNEFVADGVHPISPGAVPEISFSFQDNQLLDYETRLVDAPDVGGLAG